MQRRCSCGRHLADRPLGRVLLLGAHRNNETTTGPLLRLLAATGDCRAARSRSTPRAPASAGRGERANAELTNWKVLRKIRSSPSQAAKLVAVIQTLMIASA
jgi:hypothetical protein